MALSFTVDFKPGSPLADQFVYAVKKAVISGLLKEGDRFPSVRAVSQDLRINPNTVHKATSALVADGFLVVDPGVGMRVGAIPPGSEQERGQLLGAEVEGLVVQAKALHLSLPALQDAVASHWKRLS